MYQVAVELSSLVFSLKCLLQISTNKKMLSWGCRVSLNNDGTVNTMEHSTDLRTQLIIYRFVTNVSQHTFLA